MYYTNLYKSKIVLPKPYMYLAEVYWYHTCQSAPFLDKCVCVCNGILTVTNDFWIVPAKSFRVNRKKKETQIPFTWVHPSAWPTPSSRFPYFRFSPHMHPLWFVFHTGYRTPPLFIAPYVSPYDLCLIWKSVYLYCPYPICTHFYLCSVRVTAHLPCPSPHTYPPMICVQCGLMATSLPIASYVPIWFVLNMGWRLTPLSPCPPPHPYPLYMVRTQCRLPSTSTYVSDDDLCSMLVIIHLPCLSPHMYTPMICFQCGLASTSPVHRPIYLCVCISQIFEFCSMWRNVYLLCSSPHVCATVVCFQIIFTVAQSCTCK